MKKIYISLFTISLSLGSIQVASASAIGQYASSVINFSSQWSTASWSANQVLGASDTFGYGDISTSWAPSPMNGSLEYITVGFQAPAFATGVTVRETYGNGFVYQIDVLDLADQLHTVWSGTDDSQPGSPVDFLATWTATDFLVDGIKIYTNTDHNLGAWEEIDSIQLHGTTVVPVPTAVWLFGSGLIGLIGVKNKSSKTSVVSA